MLTQFHQHSKAPQTNPIGPETNEVLWWDWDEFEQKLLHVNLKQALPCLARSLIALSTSTKVDHQVWLSMKDPSQYVFIETTPIPGKEPNEERHWRIHIRPDERSQPMLTLRTKANSRLQVEHKQSDPRVNDLLNLIKRFQLNVIACGQSTSVSSQSQSEDLSLKKLSVKEMSSSKNETEKTIHRELQATTINQEDDEIVWVNLKEFEAMVTQWSSLPSFESRIKALQSDMSRSGNVYKLWLSFDQEYSESAMLILKPKFKFDSNTFHKKTKDPDISGLKNKHWGLYLYEKPEDKNIPPYFNWQFSMDGKCSELYYLSSSQHVRGNQVMSLFKKVTQSLKPDIVYLQDDARTSKDYRLRVLRPLTHNDKQTWYQSHGFELLDCDQVPYDSGEGFYKQSAKQHKKSIEILRNAPLNKLNLWLKEADKDLLKSYSNLYLPKFKFQSLTLNQLTKEVFNTMKGDSRKSRSASLHMTKLYEFFLDPEAVELSANGSFGKKYTQALNEVFDSRLFFIKP